MPNNFKVILWDFDGVLMNSNAIRDLGFETVLSSFPVDKVAQLMTYHKANGGLSRYAKFRYFFEEILKESVTDATIEKMAASFSIIMRKYLVNPDLLIKDSMNFVRLHHEKYAMHIVSGSDQQELRYFCQELGISIYFLSINGSPTSKKKLVMNLLNNFRYNKREVLLIGDSINDYDAAIENNIHFMGYNNSSLKSLSSPYIDSFEKPV